MSGVEECSVCDECGLAVRYMFVHWLRAHPSAGEAVARRRQLWERQQAVRDRLRAELACDVCQARAHSLASAARHWQSSHAQRCVPTQRPPTTQPPPTAAAELPATCDDCGLASRSLRAATLHHHWLRRHVESRSALCAAAAVQRSDEGRRRHRQVPLSCEDCDYVAAGKQGMQRHWSQAHLGRAHAKTPADITCDVCGHWANQRILAHNHWVRWHCARKAIRSALDAESRERIHRRVKVKCDLCGHSCLQKGQLMEHCRAVHLFLPPRQRPRPCRRSRAKTKASCDGCEQRFDQAGVLWWHWLRRHPLTSTARRLRDRRVPDLRSRDMALCDLCLTPMATKFVLINHLRSRHAVF